MDDMGQIAPFPEALARMVESLRYKPGWTFSLRPIDRGQGSVGLTLDILTSGYNSYHPETGPNYRVHHYMPVPPAAYNEQSWRRWLLDQLIKVESHEACEFFRFEYEGQFTKRDGSISDTYVERPYAPHHGPGQDPYIIFEHGTDDEVRTNFKGITKDPE
jgi:hypothetical protein